MSKSPFNAAKIEAPGGVTMTVSVEMVTPEKAREWLEANTRNRKLRKRQVEILTADILAGAWEFTHQGIAFGLSGQLLDGQHRLQAIVSAGTGVPLVVWRDVPEKAQEGCDMTAARSVAENLGLQDGEANAAKLAAFVNAINLGLTGRSSRLSLPQVRRMLTALPGIKELAKHDTNEVLTQCRNAAICGALALALHIPKLTNEVGNLYEAYSRGVNCPKGSPGLLLRDYAVRNAPISGREARREAFNAACNAVRAWLLMQPMAAGADPEGRDWVIDQLKGKAAELRAILRA